MKLKLIVASNNAHKVEEFRRILEPLGYEVLSQKEAGIQVKPEENGETFAENARIKALAVFEASGCPCVADDSGLCVDALGGRPGVHSARYLGEETPQEQKNAGLLAELGNLPREERGAQFVSAICCVLADGSLVETLGVCPGWIGYEPLGEGGFGYDPIFMVGERSYGQLSPQEKDAISHRGLALRELEQRLLALDHQ